MSTNVKTGLLNYFINTDKIAEVTKTHKGIVAEIKKFKPTSKTQKAFNAAYKKFISHKESLDLTKFGFIMELGIEDAFGVRNKYFKSPVNNFFWSEIFEAVHFNIVK